MKKPSFFTFVTLASMMSLSIAQESPPEPALDDAPDAGVILPEEDVPPVDPADIPLEEEEPLVPNDEEMPVPPADEAVPETPPAPPVDPEAPLPTDDPNAIINEPPPVVEDAQPPVVNDVPPPAYDNPNYIPRVPATINIRDVVREPVSIHEARQKVLRGDICGSLAALDTLATRYPADARVYYLKYVFHSRLGQSEEAMASLERAVSMEYLQPVSDYDEFMAPIQGADRFYAERVRRSVRDLDLEGVLIPPKQDEVIILPEAPDADNS